MMDIGKVKQREIENYKLTKNCFYLNCECFVNGNFWPQYQTIFNGYLDSTIQHSVSLIANFVYWSS
jgi:hypothetical protein